MQRIFHEEFYTWPLLTKAPELQRELNAYLDHYNCKRLHRALNGLLAMTQAELVLRRVSAVLTDSQPLY